jgi:hypothetical protein
MLAEIDKDARDIAALQETTQRLASKLEGVQSHLNDHLDPMEKLLNGHVRELAFLRGENTSSKLDLQSIRDVVIKSIRDAGQKAEARLEAERNENETALRSMRETFEKDLARLESENKAMTQSLSAINRQYSMLIDMLTKLDLQRKGDDLKPFLINADTGEEIVLDLLPGYEKEKYYVWMRNSEKDPSISDNFKSTKSVRVITYENYEYGHYLQEASVRGPIMQIYIQNVDTGSSPMYEFFGQYKRNGYSGRTSWWQQKVGQSYFPAGIPFSLMNHALIQFI